MKEIACASGVDLLTDYLEGCCRRTYAGPSTHTLPAVPDASHLLASYRETPSILREATATTLPADLQTSLQAFLRTQRRLPPAED